MDKSITNAVQLEAVKDNGGFIKNSSEKVKNLSFKRIRESIEKEDD